MLAAVGRYLVRRLGLGVLTLALVSFLSWVIFATALNPTWQFFQTPHAPEVLAMRARAHVDDPVLVRYWYWLRDLFTGKGLGHTVVTNQAVWPAVAHAFVVSIELVAYSLVLVAAGSILVGTVAARYRGGAIDVGLRAFSYVAWAIPAFLVALLIAGGATAVSHHGFNPFGIDGVRHTGFVGWLQVDTLPAVAVALAFIGVYSRYLRTTLIVTMNETYTVVARAKGLPERTAIRRYALRNALIPFVSIISLELGALVGATIAADYVFGLRGLASLLYISGLTQGDPFVIQAPILLCAALVIGGSIVADVAIGFLDPRVRLR
jgi:peptide/nickel transport system permease protein